MKVAIYWIGATLLVITLLLCGFFTAAFISDRGWPFQHIWGAGLAALGLLLVALTRFAPALIWGGDPRASGPGAAIPKSIAHIPAVLGVTIIVGGVGYVVTGRIDVMIGLFAAAVIYARVATWRAQRALDDQEPPGPAA